MTTAETIAAILAAHATLAVQRVSSRGGVNHAERFCCCGESMPWDAKPLGEAHRAHVAAAIAEALGSSDDGGCECPPCPGRGNDGHRMTHCAECCFGTGVQGEMECPVHGVAAVTGATS